MDCLDCQKFLTCKKSEKSKGFRCDLFSQRKVRDIYEILGDTSEDEEEDFDALSDENLENELVEDAESPSALSGKYRTSPIIIADEKVNVEELINNVISSDLLTPVDARIDDSSIPTAANFLEFATGSNFLNIKPFVMQVNYLTQLLGEYCPKCSDVSWMNNGIKVGDSLAYFQKKVQLLRFGVCPNCGSRKSELIKNNELNFYQELAGLAGQRCITGESVVFTSHGLRYVEEFDVGLDYELNPLTEETFLLTKEWTFRPAESFYKSYPEETYRVELENGFWIEGTKEHPVLTTTGYHPLCKLRNKTIPVKFGFSSFGQKEISLSLAKFLGIWLAAGQGFRLSIIDQEAYLITKEVFPEVYLDEEENSILFDGRNLASFSFPKILGFDPNAVREKMIVPKVIRTANKESVLAFLSGFFAHSLTLDQGKLSIDAINSRVQLVLAAYLQMLGIYFFLQGENRIEIASESVSKFEFYFGILPSSVSESLDRQPTLYSKVKVKDGCFLFKVKSVAKSFYQTTYDFVVPEDHNFIANGLVNHNSGKSAMVAMCSAYILHKLLKLQKPNEVYGLLSSNVLHGTFVALTYKQASETLWEPFLAYITTSPWFNDFHALLDHYGRKYGEEFYKVKDTFITYKTRRLLLYPAGPNKKTLRGRCLTGNTLISTNEGFLRLDEIIDRDGFQEISEFYVATEHGKEKVTHLYRTRAKTLKITTENGFVLEGTPEHPVLTVTENGFRTWVPLQELKFGDRIVSWTEKAEVLFGKEDADQQHFVSCCGTGLHLRLRMSHPKTLFYGIALLLKEFLYFYRDEEYVVFVFPDREMARQIHIILYQALNILGKLEERKEDSLLMFQDLERQKINIFMEMALQKDPELFEMFNFYREPITRYEVVAKIEENDQEQYVYDISVPNGNSFLANGLTSHNTRFLASIDEIGWFDNNRDRNMVKMDANEVYIALDRSLLTVRSAAQRLIHQGFDDIPNGYALNISSPSSARDKIMELVNQSKDSKKILGFKRPTWEMNPNITKERDLSEEFARDPQGAERDYGCNPPLSDNAFFSSFAAIEECFIGKPNKLKYGFKYHRTKDGITTKYAMLEDVVRSSKPNVIALDCGYSNNSFALVCGHLHEGIPVITCLCEVIPNPGVPVNHALVFRELIHPLIRERNVKMLISDRWQNIKLLQDAELEFEDLNTISYSLKYPDFWNIKQTMFDAEVVFPKLPRKIEDILKFDQYSYPHCFNHSPMEHLAVQFMTVRDMGNSVDKGDGLTDDLFRASCLAIYALNNPEYYDLFSPDGEEEIPSSKKAVGIVMSRSSGRSGKTGEAGMTSSGKALGVSFSRR